MQSLRSQLSVVAADEDRQAMTAERDRWMKAGFSDALAQDLAALSALTSALDIIDVAESKKLKVGRVAEVYFTLGEALHLKWLMARIEELAVEGRWHAHARGSLRDELYSQQQALAAQVLANSDGGSGRALVAAWLGRDDAQLRFTLSMLADMRTQTSMDYPTVLVAVRRLAQLVQAGARA